MKTFICVVVGLFAFHFGHTQALTVAADKLSIAYIGILNPLTITLERCSCANLYATTTNGTIEKKDSCRFLFIPVREGNTEIELQTLKSGKITVVGKKTVMVKTLPDPVALVGNRRSGSYPLAEFRVQTGISVRLPNMEIDKRFKVTSFSITFLRNWKVIYTAIQTGNLFSSETIFNLSHLKSGDVILIQEIKIVGVNICPRIIESLSYTMR